MMELNERKKINKPLADNDLTDGKMINFVELKDSLITMDDIAVLKSKCDSPNQEDLLLLLNVAQNTDILHFVQQLFHQISVGKKEMKTLYLAKNGNEDVLGVISIQPVCCNPSTMEIEYCWDSYLTGDYSLKAVKEAFVKYYYNQPHESVYQEVRNKKARFFSPQLEETESLLYTQTRPDAYQKLSHSKQYMMRLTMPQKIGLNGFFFSMRRIKGKETEIQDVFELIQRNQPETERFLPVWQEECSSLSKTENFLKNQMNFKDSMLSVRYGIYEAEKLVGLLECCTRGDVAHLNILVDKDSGARGYASEALRLAEREIFKHGINEIQLECSAYNYLSPRVVVANGYKLAELYDEYDSMHYYHKVIGDYLAGNRATHSLLKPKEKIKVVQRYVRCPLIDNESYSR